MPLRRLGLIGAGGIARLALSALASELARPLEQVSVLVPPDFSDQAQVFLDTMVGRLALAHVVRTEVAAMIGDRPDVVAECASHRAVCDFGPSILAAGIDLVIISIGALADARLYARLQDAARAAGSRIVLPPGAIGGVDAIVAARLSGIRSVVYTGRKPPPAWRGTPAERMVDLNCIDAPVVVYDGSAGEAATIYPFNANVTATLALAGIGFEQTRVRLIADPSISWNVHEFEVHAGCGDFTVRLEGQPSASNPKTSMLAGYSVARELLNRAALVVI